MTPRAPLTRAQWDALSDEHWKAARKRYPTARMDKLQRRVWDTMVEAYGKPPEKPKDPTSLWWARLLFALVKGDARMQYDLKKGLLKGVKGAAASAVAMAVLFFLGAFDSTPELLAMGIPSQVAPLVVMGVSFAVSTIRNWLKVKGILGANT